MTENELRNWYVSVLTSWVGRKESDGSHKAIIDIYNRDKPLPSSYSVKYSDAWCATTISAAAIVCGITDIIPKECSCPRQIELFKKLGRWVEDDNYIPRMGDIIYYSWKGASSVNNTGVADHVGAVVSVKGSTITVVEGNKSDAVGYRTISVGAASIRGYGIPDFAGKAAKMNGATTASTTPIQTQTAQTTTTTKTETKVTTGYDPAQSFSKSFAKTFTVTASSLNVRKGAGTSKQILGAIPKGSKATCYGYYSMSGSQIWLLVKAGSYTGYVCKTYLK